MRRDHPPPLQYSVEPVGCYTALPLSECLAEKTPQTPTTMTKMGCFWQNDSNVPAASRELSIPFRNKFNCQILSPFSCQHVYFVTSVSSLSSPPRMMPDTLAPCEAAPFPFTLVSVHKQLHLQSSVCHASSTTLTGLISGGGD